MRLRKLATHCKFGDQLKKEIELQFVVVCNMDDVQRKCARTDDLTLAKVIEYATGFERLSHNLNDLNQAQTTRVGAIQSSGYRKSTNASRFSNSRQTETGKHIVWLLRQERAPGQSPMSGLRQRMQPLRNDEPLCFCVPL